LRARTVGSCLGPHRCECISLLPVFHDMREGELAVVVHALQHEVLGVEVNQGVE